MRVKIVSLLIISSITHVDRMFLQLADHSFMTTQVVIVRDQLATRTCDQHE